MESKIILSTGGIIVVLAAVGGSLGIFGYIGVTTTMLTIEVESPSFYNVLYHPLHTQ